MTWPNAEAPKDGLVTAHMIRQSMPRRWTGIYYLVCDFICENRCCPLASSHQLDPVELLVIHFELELSVVPMSVVQEARRATRRGVNARCEWGGVCQGRHGMSNGECGVRSGGGRMSKGSDRVAARTRKMGW